MKQHFWKMHGAGNDFILFDDRAGTLPANNHAILKDLATRRTGIGCEGIILLQSDATADVRMRFFNPDGRPAEMCGNGARCAARLAVDLGIAPAELMLATDAGSMHVSVNGDTVTLSLPPPRGIDAFCELQIDGTPLSCGTANTSVPHVVLEVDDITQAPVTSLGRTIRYHQSFAPEGTNVNFVQRLGNHRLAIRTYERGVEDETGACGTGATAAAIVMSMRKRVDTPVTVVTSYGDELQIGFHLHKDRVSDLTLTGPVAYTFEGDVTLR